MEEETWNRKLIDIVSSLPIIYNQFHPDKKNKNKNESTWKEVAAKMNSSVQFCQMRWGNLRSTYARKHKKVSGALSGSGVQAPEAWPYFSQLSFLESYIKHRSTKDNFFSQEVTETEEMVTVSENFDCSAFSNGELEGQLNNSDTPTCSETVYDANGSKKRKTVKESDQREFQRKMLNVLETSHSRLASLSEPRQNDRFDNFGAFIASELRAKSPQHVTLYMQHMTQVLYADISSDF